MRTRWSRSYAEFLDNGEITFPANALPTILVEACGGGGAGGGGGMVPSSSFYSTGGGGGGGAVLSTRMLVIEPGVKYDLVIGAGGVGGSGGTGYAGDPLSGTDGADSTITKHTGGLIATWRGGAGGNAGVINSSDGLWVKSLGGSPTRTTYTRGSASFDATTMPILKEINDTGGIPSHGASGLSSNFGAVFQSGGASPQGFVGGNTGVADTTSSGSYRGGGPGGGGGGGPYGVGGTGGDGGDPNNSGFTSGGTAGISGAVNTGAGGGGGGGAGGASSATVGIQYGGSGHKGGTGRMRIVYFVPVV